MISAIATGDWADTDTWNGGVVPSTGDQVDLAGFAVAFNTTATIASLTDTGSGAGLTVATGTLTGSLIAIGGTTLVTVTGTLDFFGSITSAGGSTAVQVNGVFNWNANNTVVSSDTSIGINNAGTFNINTTIQFTSSGTATALGGGGVIATSGSQVVVTRGSSSDTVPAVTDVRLGVVYGPSASLVGTLQPAVEGSTLHWNPADPKHWD